LIVKRAKMQAADIIYFIYTLTAIGISSVFYQQARKKCSTLNLWTFIGFCSVVLPLLIISLLICHCF